MRDWEKMRNTEGNVPLVHLKQSWDVNPSISSSRLNYSDSDSDQFFQNV